MRDVLGPGTILGYCTNVHAGETLTLATDNLFRYGADVKKRVCPQGQMGVGWWLSAQSVLQFIRSIDQTLSWLKPRLKVEEMFPFTLNGFPYGVFHEVSIKHRVYEPSWDRYDRFAYTECLLHFIVLLSDKPGEHSISTLPIGWPDQPCRPVNVRLAASHLLGLIRVLKQAEHTYGLVIHVDLEPEPGCILQSSADVVQFFKDELLLRARELKIDESLVLRHIRVCHDICHAAVMFEDQGTMFERYRVEGIKVGKVQISNAIRVPFDEYSESERHEALRQLNAFAEDRYLHQTMIRFNDGTMKFFDDLPKAIQSVPQNQTARGEWRVHFHVPVYLESFGLLKTTRDHIIECMKLLKNSEVKHWEVETYAWDVLPPELKVPDLAEGIARELLWVKEQAAKIK